MIRRMCSKDTEIRDILDDSYRLLHGIRCCGTLQDDTDLRELKTAQPKRRSMHWTNQAPNGPMGHLLHSLHEVGAVMDEKYTILQHNEAPTAIMDIPDQHLKPVTRLLATRARTRASCSSRQETINLKEIGTRVSMKTFNGLDEKEANTLRTTMTGSTWANATLFHCGQTKGQICDLCGDGVIQTPEHIIWTCKTYCEHRFDEDTMLGKIPIAAIPKPLRHGIAPAMAATFNTTMLGTNLQWADRQTREALGANQHDRIKSATTHAAVRDTMQQDGEKQNARQLFQTLSSTIDAEQPKIKPPKMHEGTAPSVINVYTDGAMKQPHSQFWGLLGYGVWWTARVLALHPISNQEHQHTNGHHEDKEKCNVRLWGQLCGHRGSSTRAEIAAILVALCPGMPTHIGTDSKSAMTVFLKLKSEIERRRSWPKDVPIYNEWPMGVSWKLADDGDLWEQIWDNLLCRSISSTAITKVKGHATEEDVREGRATAADRCGNNIADLAADEGVQAHGNATIELGRLYEERHIAYQKLTQRIQQHIIRMMVMHMEHRRSLATEVNPYDEKIKEDVTINRSYAEQTDIGMVEPKFMALPNHTNITHNINRQTMCQIRDIFVKQKWVMQTMHNPGVSWMRLFAAATMQGIKLEDAENNRTLPMQLQLFKETARHIFQQCLSQSDQAGFKANKASKLRLNEVAINIHMPCIRALPVWDQEQAIKVTRAMLQLVCKMTPNRIYEHGIGALKLVPSRPRIKGPIPWANEIAEAYIMSGKALQEHYVPNVEERRTIHYNKYKIHIDMTRKTMRTKMGWRLLECTACGNSCSANQWLCRCDIPWYTCDKHSSPWFDPPNGPNTYAKTKKKVISLKPFMRKKKIIKHTTKHSGMTQIRAENNTSNVHIQKQCNQQHHGHQEMEHIDADIQSNISDPDLNDPLDHGLFSPDDNGHNTHQVNCEDNERKEKTKLASRAPTRNVTRLLTVRETVQKFC